MSDKCIGLSLTGEAVTQDISHRDWQGTSVVQTQGKHIFGPKIKQFSMLSSDSKLHEN